jgi:hypothetical protein
MSFFHKKMSQNLWATIMPFGPTGVQLKLQKHPNAYIAIK